MDKAYTALAQFDYFKARKLFIEANKKKTNAQACYGLAWITLRTDNPFHQIDTALYYVNCAFHQFLLRPEKFVGSGFLVDSLSIRRLADTIAYQCLKRAKEINTVAACDQFLLNNFLCRKKYIYDAIYLRDDLEFNQVIWVNKSDSTQFFITTHPQSTFLKEALVLLDRQFYDEQTREGKAETYLAFLRQYPINALRNTAFDKLFSIYRQSKDVQGLGLFVKEFPKAPQNLEAWKLLFSLSVKAYNFAELKRFTDIYPNFPLKNSILKELELNKLQLRPLLQGDLMGYIDENGQPAILPQYDEASDFSEGLAVVWRNDSCFYINKVNVNPFGKSFSAASLFHESIAAVKQKGKWFFINRLGQAISEPYDEIQEYSGGAYIFKTGDKYGAFDQYGHLLLEPKFAKLGDFKNGFAYYTEDGKYGFVSKDGIVYKAQYDWISEFNEEQIAVIRQNGKYGLVLGNGKILLDCAHDQVFRAPGRLFLVINDGLYGFFSFDQCFISLPQFDFDIANKPEYYSNGHLFRLDQKDESSLMDVNGKVLIAAGLYSDFGFPSGGLTRVQKKNKWAYLDQKFNIAIPFRYQEASDFEEGAAVVKYKDQYSIINLNGENQTVSDQLIERVSAHYFLQSADQGDNLLDRFGHLMQSGIEEVKVLLDGKILLRLRNGEIKLINE